MIRGIKLTRKFGSGETEVVALKNVDIEIAEKEFVAIIGPSGAGKSTLMYQLSLLDEPTSGEVFINGVKTSDLSITKKTSMRLHELGYVFQDYALLPELSSLDNVALPMLMQGMTRQMAEHKAIQALTRIGLADKLHSLPSQLSGGQQQRVSIARAIAHDPHIVFADEPTANLDSGNARVVLEAFLDLHRGGQTIVMVTHEEEYAAAASRVISLKDGEIISDVRK